MSDDQKANTHELRREDHTGMSSQDSRNYRASRTGVLFAEITGQNGTGQMNSLVAGEKEVAERFNAAALKAIEDFAFKSDFGGDADAV